MDGEAQYKLAEHCAQRLPISDVLHSDSGGECGEALADIGCCVSRRVVAKRRSHFFARYF